MTTKGVTCSTFLDLDVNSSDLSSSEASLVWD